MKVVGRHSPDGGLVLGIYTQIVKLGVGHLRWRYNSSFHVQIYVTLGSKPTFFNEQSRNDPLPIGRASHSGLAAKVNTNRCFAFISLPCGVKIILPHKSDSRTVIRHTYGLWT